VRFATTPRDLLVTFIRGYAYRADWAECAFVFLERALGWREEVGMGRLVRDPPPDRTLFEEICPSGPVARSGTLCILALRLALERDTSSAALRRIPLYSAVLVPPHALLGVRCTMP